MSRLPAGRLRLKGEDHDDADCRPESALPSRHRCGQDLLLVRLRPVGQSAVLRRLAQGGRSRAEAFRRGEGAPPPISAVASSRRTRPIATGPTRACDRAIDANERGRRRLPPAFSFPATRDDSAAGPDLGDARSDVVVDVLAPVAVDTAYSYRAPSELEARAWSLRARAARNAAGDRRRLGRRVPAAATISNPSPRSSTGRRSAPRCAILSIGSRAGRWRRAACCCAWRSARARSPRRRRRNSASSPQARRRPA